MNTTVITHNWKTGKHCTRAYHKVYFFHMLWIINTSSWLLYAAFVLITKKKSGLMEVSKGKNNSREKVASVNMSSLLNLQVLIPSQLCTTNQSGNTKIGLLGQVQSILTQRRDTSLDWLWKQGKELPINACFQRFPTSCPTWTYWSQAEFTQYVFRLIVKYHDNLFARTHPDTKAVQLHCEEPSKLDYN